MTGWLSAIALLGLLCWLPPAGAQEFVRIGNRLTPDQFLHIERGPIQSGRIEPHWWSAQWRLEPVPGTTEFVRIRNRWKAGEFLRVRQGEVDWAVLSVPGGPYVRLRSRARDGEYLHLERGVLQTGAVPRDAPSSHWLLAGASKAPAVSSPPAGYRMVNRQFPHFGLPLVPVADLPYVRVPSGKNEFAHIERGRLEYGAIEPGWWSAQWRVEPVPGTPYSRIRNRWRGDQLLHLENGALKSGPLKVEVAGAQWMLAPESATAPVPPGPSGPASPPGSDRWHGPN
jgi:hypothetical protein